MRRMKPKHDAIKVEGVLNDASGGDPGAKDVLLGGEVVLRGGPVKLLHETVPWGWGEVGEESLANWELLNFLSQQKMTRVVKLRTLRPPPR